MRIGIAYDLKSDFETAATDPDDRLEEYDSEGTVRDIAGALEEGGHTPVLLGGGRRFLERVLADPPDLVFNIAEGHGTRSREAHVPAVCELLGIPFTHSDPLTLAVALDKAMAKHLAAGLGVPTPPFRVVASLDDLEGFDLAFPVITKPLFEGSSMGIRKTSRCADLSTLKARIAPLLSDYRQPVLVEEFCTGPEFTVGVLGNGPTARVLGILEIHPRKGTLEEFVYSLEVKRNYVEEVEYRVPPQRPAALLARVEQVALDAYRGLGCRDVSRVDLRVGADGTPKFIEVNPLPGINSVTGDIVILAKAMGLTYPELVLAIVEEARERLGLR